MTPAELLALSDAECNERLAVAMGWTKISNDPDEVFPWLDEGAMARMEPAAYCSDLNLMAAVEAEIARRGLHERYASTLHAVLVLMPEWVETAIGETLGIRPLWLILTAPASARARAALRVLDAK